MSSTVQSIWCSMAKWSLKDLLEVKIRSQIVHMWNFWWVAKCCWNERWDAKLFPHLSQTQVSAPSLWALAMWCLSSPGLKKKSIEQLPRTNLQISKIATKDYYMYELGLYRQLSFWFWIWYVTSPRLPTSMVPIWKQPSNKPTLMEVEHNQNI